MNFKCLGSRHIHKEIEIRWCVFRINEIIWKTGLKSIQTLTHKCNIIKEENFEAIWSQFMYLCGIHNLANCVHQKGVTFYAMTPILTYITPSYFEYIALTTAAPFNTDNPSVVFRSNNWRLHYRFLPNVNFHWHFDIHEKDYENVAQKSDNILSSEYCICFAVCTMFWKEYILIKWIVKNTTA